MCGLIGAIGVELPLSMWQSPLLRRGADHLGVVSCAGLTAYHSRHAVVASGDRSADQPLWHNKRALFCNGYISNAGEVLAEHGMGGVTADCQAVLAVFDTDGVSGLARLRGQFAAAVVDPVLSELVLVRDSTGICPLYYAEVAGGLIFGSQASWVAQASRAAVPNAETEIDEDAAAEFRALGYVIGPRTLIRNVRQVMPGTAAVFDLETGARRTSCRWDAALLSTQPPSTDIAQSLRRAVARNLGGDFEPWLLLSGGLDSLLVLHCAVEAGAKPVAVVLAYPDEANRSEVEQARIFAHWYGVDLHIVAAEPPNHVIAPQRLRDRVDWPFDGGSLVPKITLADFVSRRHGRVVLGGTGADELFGGYSRHQKRLGLLGPGRTRASDEAERRFFIECLTAGPGGDAAWHRFLDADTRYGDPAFVYDLLELSMLHNVRVDSCFGNVAIEYRPVFQDLDVVRLAAELPLRVKTSPGRPKAILRDAFKGAIRQDFLAVPKSPLRYGHMAPSAAWRSTIFAAWMAARRQATDDTERSDHGTLRG